MYWEYHYTDKTVVRAHFYDGNLPVQNVKRIFPFQYQKV